ncbi:hypothetical protein AAMO2058_000036400 [Amorphochlora amoebiformis]
MVDHRVQDVSLAVKAGAFLACLGAVAFSDAVLLEINDETSNLIRNLSRAAVVAAFLLAFTNGANDIANSVGTSVGAGALTLRTAILAGCVFEFAGGLIVGPLVSDTLSHGIIDLSSFGRTPNKLVKIMFCSILGSALSTLGATSYGIPVSATKGVITSMVVLALIVGGPQALNFYGLQLMGLTFIISPISGLLGAYLLHALILNIIVLSPKPVDKGRAYLPLLAGITIFVSFLSLTFKGPMAITPVPLAFIASVVVGGIAGLIWPLLLEYNDPTPDIELSEKKSNLPKNSPEKPNSQPQSATVTIAPTVTDSAPAVTPNTAVTRNGSGEKKEKMSGLDAIFSPLVVMSGFVVAFAHGGNDVSNAAGPLSVIAGYSANPQASLEDISRPYWTNSLAAVGFVCGILIMGGRTVKLVGVKLAKQTATKAFATQFGAACTILVASLVHQTVSTSHVLVGSVVGASIAEKHWAKSAEDVDFKVLLKIVIGWIVTIPIAGGIAWMCFYAVNIFSGQW